MNVKNWQYQNVDKSHSTDGMQYEDVFSVSVEGDKVVFVGGSFSEIPIDAKDAVKILEQAIQFIQERPL